MAIILDIETYKGDNDNYNAYKLAKYKFNPDEVSVPKSYKTEKAIADYIESAKQKNNEARQQAMDKFGLSPMTGKVILIGMLYDNVNGQIETPYGKVDNKIIDIVSLGSEEAILKMFWSHFEFLVDERGTLPVVTYNGKKFDFPFLEVRSMILGIPKPTHLRFSELTARYNTPNHVDIFEKLNPNYGDYSSLSEWSFLTGDNNDLSSDGDKIAGWFEAGEMSKIREKNMQDLLKTYYLYNKGKEWWL